MVPFMQGSRLGAGEILAVLNHNKELRTVVIGYSIAPQPQQSSSFTVGKNITTTAARDTGGTEVPIAIRVTGTNPLEVSLLLFLSPPPCPFSQHIVKVVKDFTVIGGRTERGTGGAEVPISVRVFGTAGTEPLDLIVAQIYRLFSVTNPLLSPTGATSTSEHENELILI